MIVVCTDDLSLMAVAQETSALSSDVYGSYYQAYSVRIPPVGDNENLFIIAHGAFEGDEDKPVIGDERNAFYVNGEELYVNIKDTFPDNYSGNVYIDACESADSDMYTYSFAESFKRQIQHDHPNADVFGRNGKVSGLIPPPDDPKWTKA